MSYLIPFVGGYYDGVFLPSDGPIDLLWVFPAPVLMAPGEDNPYGLDPTDLTPIDWEVAITMPAFQVEQPYPIYHYRKLGGVYKYQGLYFPGKSRVAGLPANSLNFMRKTFIHRLEDFKDSIAVMIDDLKKDEVTISERARRIVEEDIKAAQEELEDILEVFHRIYPPIQ
jgi:hypothetical protein